LKESVSRSTFHLMLIAPGFALHIITQPVSLMQFISGATGYFSN
jgi:hypothetical protein